MIGQMRTGAPLDQREIRLADLLVQLGSDSLDDLVLRQLSAKTTQVTLEAPQEVELLAKHHFNLKYIYYI